MSVCTIVGLWLFIAALCCSTTATADKRIVNGVLATTGKYPYQASLQTVAGNTHFCGGSILKTRWIVTAAHCLDNRVAADIKVVVGTLTLTGGTSYLVTRFVQHSSYVASTRIYDAAIVQTTTAIVFSATVKALRLANIVPIAGVSGVVTGWGSTVLNGPVSNDLGSLSTKVISNSSATAAPDKRIVNGVLATTGQYPYQASLQTVAGNTHFCGGSILNTLWIVTAAHCLDNRVAADIKVVVGTLTLTGGTSYLVTRFVQHPLYVASTRIYDAAIVQTSTAIVLSTTVKRIYLSPVLIIPSVSGVVTGWGPTVLNGAVSNDLRSLSTKVISNSECKTKLAATKTTVQSTHTCTYLATSGTCGSDEGGPIVVVGIQFGIVSTSSCSQNLPDVYTSTQSVYFWIMKNAK
ncbi:hypothetical protein RN001_011399 [Aquatica leii]|uniref:Peptidase S1 domain-containing protein n=1 Tax=Aquatica leii TaxID=1421715 RepID=A0AAN7SNQ4_9COLE|nr:hypothetical protein RN001_011399 [Aquatica leii]